jgi:hypothetical protein
MRFVPLAAIVTTVCLAVISTNTRAQPAPSPTQDGDSTFLGRFFQAYHDGLFPPPGSAEAPTATPSVCLQGPLDSPPFPSSGFSYGGNPGMCQDGTADRGALMRALDPTAFGKYLDANRISLYGWLEPGFDFSSSRVTKQGNAPAAYDFNANAAFLNQATFYIERVPDTIQTDHVDWGFRVTNIYGTDYRYTTMYGIASDQLLKENHWAGWDIPMAYADLYVPDIGYGTNFRIGRYISLPDIEAQLAPDNYFYSHSILYTTDPYTQIGLVSTTKLDPLGQWQVQFGISGGNDVAPWAGHNLVQPTFTFGVNYTSPNSRDNVYIVANSTNDGKFGYNNLQSYYFTWYHIFDNPKFHTATESWYMYQNETPNAPDAVAESFYGVNGPLGAYCRTGTRCQSHEWAILNYTMYEIGRHDAIGLRNEYYDDMSGQRTGFQTGYYEVTFGWNHYFSDDIYIRPELGHYHAFNAKVFNGGTKTDLTMFAMDLIVRY